MRRFKVNTHLTFPIGLLSAPGANYLMSKPGSTVEIDEKRAAEFDRFLRGRVRAGDLTEIATEPANAKEISR